MNYLKKYLFRIESLIILLPIVIIILWPQLPEKLFSAEFISRGEVYKWNKEIIWLHILTDSAIGAAFLGISISLVYLTFKAGSDLPFRWIFISFGLFIIFGAAIRFVSVYTIWEGVYWFSGALKLFLATAAISTAIALPIVIPKIIGLIKDAKSAVDTREEINKANQDLEREIIDRKKAEDELKKAHDFLEIRVQERTAQLEKMNLDLMNEITERKKAEEALRESETLFRQLTENIRNVFYVLEPGSKKISYVSPAYEEVWGRSRESLYNNYKSWSDSIHPDDRERINEAVEKQKVTGMFQEQYRIIKPDGEVRWIIVKAFPVFDEKGKIKRITGVAEDITERKNFDEQLQASLKEKDILLKEIHHRVKNNLQIVSSLLNLQSKYITDPNTTEVFRESKNRIKSMALIHEKLYGPRDFSRINFKDYISDLSSSLFTAYSTNSKNINLNLNVENVYLSMDTAISIGLIINELISNSLKYAFNKSKVGEILIELIPENEGFYILKFEDNGSGLPENFDFNNNESLGLQLVKMFIYQVEGKIELLDGIGTKYHIRFKDKNA